RDDDVNVTLKVYDIIGREAETLFNQKRKAGTYEVIWYASRQPSGVYFYKLTACNYVETKKMIFLK
ncbi:MAG: T9SS type A sorting domain-containing protein, partial [Ignavibacteriales bacterium]|nr:T9SS type A sorting domain-containing protein [Ignavibacteriales bacterium]